ncbi:Hypothetical protein HVR_LOCUS269 [uncultured virus]|nr:Hypothetical protein HVR_LOCUS269 [uncultured virus]
MISTANLLEYARTFKIFNFFFNFFYIFGPATYGIEYKEWNRHNKTNLYSAAKVGDKFNIKGLCVISNEELTNKITAVMRK